MKTFFNILQTLVNRKIKTYPDEPFLFFSTTNIDEEFYNENIYISFFIYNVYYKEKKILYENYIYRIANAKFLVLNEYLNNIFYSNEIIEKIFTIFYKAQKCYHAFSRLAHIYRFKKYKIVVQDDLSLNTLNPNHKNTFILIENKSKFLFSINDLISIIETSISNSPNFFVDPLWPENPYNKQKLKPSTLYNIYFKMKESGRLISTLFHFFFLENFQLSNFVEQNEAFIRENSIKKFIFNSPYTTLYIPTLRMLNNNKYTKLLKIDNEFPKDKLVEIFRPFLYYYYIFNYDIKGTSKIYNYKSILNQKLKKFYEYNKSFGKKCYSINSAFNNKAKVLLSFNTNHIGFYKIPVTNIETFDSDFLFFNRNNRNNILLENRIFIFNPNDNFQSNLFQNIIEDSENYNSDYDEDDITIIQPLQNTFSFINSTNNDSDNISNNDSDNISNNDSDNISNNNSNNDLETNDFIPSQSQSNSEPTNNNNFYSYLNTSYGILSSNSREPIDIFHSENNDSNDNDSVS